MTKTPPLPSGAERARHLRRAQAVARLRHPNLARVVPLPGGAGLQPVLGDAHQLSDFTLPAGTFKRFDLEQVVRLLLDVLAGLGALHEVVIDGQPFVHGEVSPSSVYVDEHGTARLVPSLDPQSAVPNGYTSPERLLGSVPDARMDTFSVGVMLWEALAGQRLFPDPSPAAVLARQVPPIQLGPRTAWARPLCAVAERAIAFEPKARFQSAHELASAIASAAAPRLSRAAQHSWQEEAPTPVFQPRLHLPRLRASSPGPLVVDSALERAEVSPDTVSPTVSSEAEAESPPTRVRRGGRLALGAAALLLTAAVLAAPRALRGWFERAPDRISAPAAAARVVAPTPVVSPALPVASPAPVVSSAPVVSASPVSAPPPSASASAKPSKPPRAVRPKPAKTADYGI